MTYRKIPYAAIGAFRDRQQMIATRANIQAHVVQKPIRPRHVSFRPRISCSGQEAACSGRR
jgi:hypothetical protein